MPAAIFGRSSAQSTCSPIAPLGECDTCHARKLHRGRRRRWPVPSWRDRLPRARDPRDDRGVPRRSTPRWRNCWPSASSADTVDVAVTRAPARGGLVVGRARSSAPNARRRARSRGPQGPIGLRMVVPDRRRRASTSTSTAAAGRSAPPTSRTSSSSALADTAGRGRGERRLPARARAPVPGRPRRLRGGGALARRARGGRVRHRSRLLIGGESAGAHLRRPDAAAPARPPRDHRRVRRRQPRLRRLRRRP